MIERHRMKPMDTSRLFVIAVISNPMRYHARYSLYKAFQKHMEASGVNLVTVEVAFGERPFEVTEAGHPCHIQMRTVDELWHKENMINLAVSRLPHDWKYVAWIDADVEFVRKDWAEETVHALQHHHIVQPFAVAYDLGPDLTPFQIHHGFCYCHHNQSIRKEKLAYGGYWHPGFAWAATREAYNHLGGLIDIAICGAADHHMALALIGRAEESLPGKVSRGYHDAIMRWQERAERYILRDIGYVPGTILHHWHGKKKDRKYIERWSIILENGFDPEHDLKRDSQGLWQLTDRSIGLRDQLRQYFRQRNEDSIDLE